MKCKKWFLTIILLFSLLVCISASLSVSALSLNTFDNLPGNNSIVTTLLTFVPVNNDYVCFCDSDNSYYIYYSDRGSLSFENGHVVGDDLQYVHYYRSTTGQFAYIWNYSFGSGSLNLNVSHVVSSNLDFVYSSSNSLYFEQSFYYSIFILAFIITIFTIFKSVRGLFKGGAV